MDEKKTLPKRKHPRRKDFDYSSDGSYFITICTQNRKNVLSRIVGRGLAPAETYRMEYGRGLAPAETYRMEYGRGLAPAETYRIEYTLYGKIAEQQLLSLNNRFPCLEVEQYVIMPNHLHAILVLDNAKITSSSAAGASPRPTIMDVVCAYKSLTAKECKKNGFKDKLFQNSFYEHIIRGPKDYDEISRYIYENPLSWHSDVLYTE